MNHFTYQESCKDSLSQGDILEKSKEIEKIISEVHPHYLKDDYRYFIVLTQSCDLVRRGKENRCKSRYITISAVRPLESLINKQLQNFMETSFFDKINICSVNHKGKMKQFVEKLLNNNAPEYFYLNQDLNFDFNDNQVAFLKLSIAIKTDLHYETCLSSKKFELKDSFKAKLGWLVGQMYSRVGTEDWVPENIDRRTFTEKIKNVINSSACWCEDEIITSIIDNPELIEEFQKDRNKLDEYIMEKKKNTKTKKETLIETLSEIFQTKTELDEDKITTLSKVINNDPIISSLMK